MHMRLLLLQLFKWMVIFGDRQEKEVHCSFVEEVREALHHAFLAETSESFFVFCLKKKGGKRRKEEGRGGSIFVLRRKVLLCQDFGNESLEREYIL